MRGSKIKLACSCGPRPIGLVPAVRPLATFLAIGVWVLFLASERVAAQTVTLPNEAQEARQQEPPDGTVSVDASPEDDQAIARRLKEVLSNIEGLEAIRVEVDAGVVKLHGEALSAEARTEAEALAGRIEGVVTVKNEITEVRDIDRRLKPAVDKLLERLQGFATYLPLLGVAALILLVFWLIARVVVRWAWLYEQVTPNRFLRDLLRQAIRALVLACGVLIALDFLGATAIVGAVLGAAGLIGLAVSFAFRDTIENYIASLLLSLRQPFSPNDHVVIEGHEGRVVRLTSRATILLAFDGNHIRIPNATVFQSIVINYTRNPKRRFDFAVGVDTGEDLLAAQTLALQTLRAMDGVLEDPCPGCWIETLGDSNVVLRLIGWVDQRATDIMRVRSEAIRLVKQAFDDAGILMPEPTYKLHLQELTGELAERPLETGRKRPSRALLPKTAARGKVEVDLSPDTHLDRAVQAERVEFEEKDLLDPHGEKE